MIFLICGWNALRLLSDQHVRVRLARHQPPPFERHKNAVHRLLAAHDDDDDDDGGGGLLIKRESTSVTVPYVSLQWFIMRTTARKLDNRVCLSAVSYFLAAIRIGGNNNYRGLWIITINIQIYIYIHTIFAHTLRVRRSTRPACGELCAAIKHDKISPEHERPSFLRSGAHTPDVAPGCSQFKSPGEPAWR